MKTIKIYDLTFKRTAKFAPEEYKVFDKAGDEVAYVRLKGGVLQVRIHGEKINGDFVSNWEVSDISMFHTPERRNRELTKAAEKIREVMEKYGT